MQILFMSACTIKDECPVGPPSPLFLLGCRISTSFVTLLKPVGPDQCITCHPQHCPTACPHSSALSLSHVESCSLNRSNKIGPLTLVSMLEGEHPMSTIMARLAALSLSSAWQVETPVAIVDRNIDRRPANTREKTRRCAEAFVEYLFTPEAQKEFAGCGFR